MAVPEVRFVWQAKLLRVVDGDTIDVELDVGFRVVRAERLRLLAVNCPEKKGETYDAAMQAQQFVLDWFCAGAAPLVVETFKSDSFGRYLARIYDTNGRCLNDDLLTSGYAVIWEKKR